MIKVLRIIIEIIPNMPKNKIDHRIKAVYNLLNTKYKISLRVNNKTLSQGALVREEKELYSNLIKEKYHFADFNIFTLFHE